MKSHEKTSNSDSAAVHRSNHHYFRFHLPHNHLASIFGDDWFALRAEAFARFFGTPVFLVIQTIVVALWIIANVFSLTKFDIYPFILLNLAFSLQAAYAAPLILLAQTRQADRDKVNADADARHREDLAMANDRRLASTEKHTEQLMELLQQNTQLTELTQQLSQRIELLTVELHGKIVREKQRPPTS
ncbi:MAG: DUF1003 domain-containing protein [bacterium]|nr:DUF1003 domain-containing protein [bacterium]